MNRLSLFRKINNKFKSLVAKIVMLVLYRAIKVLAREDSRIMNEFLSWKDGLTVALEASPDGTAIYMQKYGDKLQRTKAWALQGHMPSTASCLTVISVRQ